MLDKSVENLLERNQIKKNRRLFEYRFFFYSDEKNKSPAMQMSLQIALALSIAQKNSCDIMMPVWRLHKNRTGGTYE